MAEPADSSSARSVRELAEQIVYAAVGAAVLTKERGDELADELSRRGQMTRDETRELVDELLARWRGDASRMGERASTTLTGAVRELGLVTRREWEELELRLAQLEHRLRLVERERSELRRPGP